jgi:hypothetical protein
MRTTLVLPLVFTLLVGASACGAQQADPQYGIKFTDPPIGSNIRRYAVSPSSIPINRSYGELSAAERAKLHQWWERIPEGDEPPFPIDGLRPIHDAVRQAQSKLLVTGELFLIATVEQDGQVSQVQAVGSPSPEMTKFSATVLVLTKFKPAVCSGHPCRMDFPVRYQFRVE